MARRSFPAAALAAAAVILAVVLWGGSDGVGDYGVTNDTSSPVTLLDCSQHMPDFPGASVIEPGATLHIPSDALPSNDKGAACYLGDASGRQSDAAPGCLRMPSTDSRSAYRVGEADHILDEHACLALTHPVLP